MVSIYGARRRRSKSTVFFANCFQTIQITSTYIRRLDTGNINVQYNEKSTYGIAGNSDRTKSKTLRTVHIQRGPFESSRQSFGHKCSCFDAKLQQTREVKDAKSFIRSVAPQGVLHSRRSTRSSSCMDMLRNTNSVISCIRLIPIRLPSWYEGNRTLQHQKHQKLFVELLEGLRAGLLKLGVMHLADLVELGVQQLPLCLKLCLSSRMVPAALYRNATCHRARVTNNGYGQEATMVSRNQDAK